MGRKIQRFMSQPFAVAEVFTGMKGKLVSLEDTISAFESIAQGEMDDIHEQAFYMVGDLTEVQAKAKELAALVSENDDSADSSESSTTKVDYKAQYAKFTQWIDGGASGSFA